MLNGLKIFATSATGQEIGTTSKSNSGGGEILEVMNLRDKTFALLQDLCANNRACEDLIDAVCSLSDNTTGTMELMFAFADRVRDETLIIDELKKIGEDFADPMVALGALKAEIARRKKKETATGGEEKCSLKEPYSARPIKCPVR